jgi:hypothetical protein
MKPQWRRQQQQQHRQQQQQQQQQHRQQQLHQQRMKQAAWMEQQRRQRQMPSQQPHRPSSRQVDQRFSRVEQEAARLRQQFAAGNLTREELASRLRELMVQDARGTWWMVGAESGRWYRYDGREWVPGIPYAPRASGLASAVGDEPRKSGCGSKVKAFFLFVLGVAMSAGAFLLVWYVSGELIWPFDYELAELLSPILGASAGLVSLIVTWRKGRRVGRGY